MKVGFFLHGNHVTPLYQLHPPTCLVTHCFPFFLFELSRFFFSLSLSLCVSPCVSLLRVCVRVCPSAPPLPPRRSLVTVKGVGSGGGVRFRLCSYNLLAEIYATQQAYPYCDFWALSWGGCLLVLLLVVVVVVASACWWRCSLDGAGGSLGLCCVFVLVLTAVLSLWVC